MMQEVTVDGIVLDVKTKTPVIVLKDNSGERKLPIYIGKYLAIAVLSATKKDKSPRPMTHDLLANFLDTWAMKLERIMINYFENNTYFAVLVVKQNGTIKEIDCRPSDAIALAMRTDSPILVSESLMNNNSVSSEQNESDYMPYQDNLTNKKKPHKFFISNFLNRLRN